MQEGVTRNTEVISPANEDKTKNFTVKGDITSLVPALQRHCYNTEEICSVLAISYLGAKHDFEIWAFEVFFSLDKKNTP